MLREYLTRHNAWVALAVYLALTLYWDRGTLVHMNSACPCGLPGDPAQYAWAFDWFPHALLHGLDPLYSKAMWSPTGINLAGATAVPFLAFVLAPITWLWGPIVSYNVITIAAPVLNCGSGYLLARYVTKAPWASMLAGIAYGFSTYETAELGGHLHLGVVFCPPLIILCVLMAVDGRASRGRTVIQLTMLLLVQMYISTEVFFTMTLLGVVLMGSSWLFAPERRSEILQVASWAAIAYAITLVVSAWYVYELLKAPAYSKDVGFNQYPTDLLAFVIPNPPTWLGGQAFTPVTGLYIGGAGETLSYIGLPMILVALRYVFTRWARASTKALTITLVASIFWILGGHLVVAGKTTIWLPYSLLGRLPVFDQVMQGRVAVWLSLWCTVVLAMWLAKPSTRWTSALRWLVALAAVAFVVPNLTDHWSGVWTNPTFFKTTMYQRYIKKGQTIMPITWGGFSESPMWQAEDHMYWNMANGYFMFPPPVGWRNQLTTDLWNDTPSAADPSLLRRFLAKRDVADVIVQASELQRWSPTLRQAGLRTTTTVGGVTIYRVPKSWLASGPRR